MAETPQRRQFALDSNVLFDLADAKDFAHTFREVFLGKGYALFAPPTVIQELVHTARSEAEDSHLALRALQCLREWQISPFDCIPVGHGITEQFVRALQQKRLLPDEEVNDGFILAETALMNIPVLVTSDQHLLEIDESALMLLFDERSLQRVRPCHPGRLLKAVNVRSH